MIYLLTKRNCLYSVNETFPLSASGFWDARCDEAEGFKWLVWLQGLFRLRTGGLGMWQRLLSPSSSSLSLNTRFARILRPSLVSVKSSSLSTLLVSSAREINRLAFGYGTENTFKHASRCRVAKSKRENWSQRRKFLVSTFVNIIESNDKMMVEDWLNVTRTFVDLEIEHRPFWIGAGTRCYYFSQLAVPVGHMPLLPGFQWSTGPVQIPPNPREWISPRRMNSSCP